MTTKEKLPYWVPPKDVRYSNEQMREFLLPNLYELADGNYPVAPRAEGSRRTDEQGRDFRNRQVNTTAPYVKPCEIAAEIEQRIEMIGPDGQMLIEYYTHGQPEWKIAKKYHRDELTLRYELRSMLIYISGWRRKRIPYQRWLKREGRS